VLPLLSGNVEDKTVEMGEVIEQSNPNHLLYIVCVAFKDFITLVIIWRGERINL